MIRLNKDTSTCSEGSASSESVCSGISGEGTSILDHEIAQLTKLRSSPYVLLGRNIPGRMRLPASTVRMLVGREGNYSGQGRFSSADRCHILSRYLPTKGPWIVDRMRSRAYISQFSADGSLFIAGFQGSQIRVYDVERGWKLKKDISARNLRWTITDTSLSPDQQHLVYASMSPIVHICTVGSAVTQSIANVTEIHYGLNFSADEDEDEFGIFSIKFSTDGQELVAATSDSSICVYDLGADKLSLRIPAHMSDVNAVCFADESGNIIYSGSDDSFCKVWDRRCFVTKGQPAGTLVGHLDGITFIDSRGDGRYLISNGKDQTTKLWDIRKMSSNAISTGLGDEDWDYRWMDYPDYARNLKHPHDQSLATYKGHSVLRTLIRCYFSPSYTTGQKYIYTGSSDSSVYIYDLVSGAQVAKLDHHEAPVRDCSWHPFYPILVTSAWDGDIVRWEFPGSNEAPASPNRRVARRRGFYHI
ncbi:LEC14B homolog [Arachis duranensis]|uniref:LEC14B homolog n=1 Tax=Arachis duranensis TaxID=130453 RepID=A0A6P4CYY2_ARADU|nr:LEC14B homolog [Arachis duranensis]XP_052117144.1 LEC14B homolog [Arachis duranensis]